MSSRFPEPLDDIEHEPGCPFIADDESDEVLYDYMKCVCIRTIRPGAEDDE